jgi:uncharacterized protein involved in type VI secretion and phage assembly
MNNEGIVDILDRLRNRFYGKYRGTVTQVDAETMRIKAKIPSVLADQESGWCVACVPYAGKRVGFAFLPEEGAGVWIEFEGGDVSYPIWTGCYWRTDEIPSDADAAVKVIVTKQHKLLFDDDGRAITLSDSSENKVSLEDSGLTLERGGNKIEVSDSEVNVNDGALEVV